MLDQTFDLFDRLGASEAQLDFPVLYASAVDGYASHMAHHRARDMTALFETIINQVPPPKVTSDGEFQMQISSLDYSRYVGTIGIGRITRGQIRPKTPVSAIDRFGKIRSGRILQPIRFSWSEKDRD